MTLVDVYDEMRKKSGWSDGDQQPEGVYEVRDELVSLIKMHLPPECTVEPYAYDRPGMHNGALILWRTKGSQNVEQCKEPDNIYDLLNKLEENEEVRVCLSISLD